MSLDNKNLEIERRWLLKSLPKRRADQTFIISQYYTFKGRYRRALDVMTETVKYYLTNKTTLAPGINQEIEKEITISQFSSDIKFATKKINKTRHVHNLNRLKFEVDVIGKIIILEIELKDINQSIEMPDFIQICIDHEITGKNEYSNYNLAVNI